jgi:Ca-activated chloride channel homolog
VNLSIAPVFPLWLIIGLALCAMGVQVAAVIASSRRRGRAPGKRTWLRLAIGLLAVLCLGLAATRIGDESRAIRPPRQLGNAEESNINVFFVVDRSLGMTAQDFAPGQPRMTAAIDDMQLVMTKYPTARFAVISYADSARLEWPLSSDTWSLIPFVQKFTPYGGREAEYGEGTPATMVSAPAKILGDKLNQAVHAYPGSANLVFIFGSGSDPGDWALNIPQGQVSGGAVFGYGTTRGESVFFEPKDKSKPPQDMRFTLNEPAMRTAADSLGIAYEHRDSGTLSVDKLPTIVPQAAPIDKVVPRVPHPNRIEYYWLFAAIAAALFAVELYDLIRYRLRRRGGGK